MSRMNTSTSPYLEYLASFNNVCAGGKLIHLICGFTKCGFSYLSKKCTGILCLIRRCSCHTKTTSSYEMGNKTRAQILLVSIPFFSSLTVFGLPLNAMLNKLLTSVEKNELDNIFLRLFYLNDAEKKKIAHQCQLQSTNKLFGNSHRSSWSISTGSQELPRFKN